MVFYYSSLSRQDIYLLNQRTNRTPRLRVQRDMKILTLSRSQARGQGEGASLQVWMGRDQRDQVKDQ